jgi:hypothetical protein
VCYSLGRKAFNELLGPIEDVWRFEALRKVPVLFALSEQQLFELARCMKNHSISAGQMVFRQGDPGMSHALIKLYILDQILFGLVANGLPVPLEQQLHSQ